MRQKWYKHRKLRTWIAMSGIIGAMLCAGCSSDTKEEAQDTKLTPFPEFSTVDLEGNTIDNEFFKNKKLTMVNIWGTYCSPCIQEMSGLGELAEENEEDFQILGIISDVIQVNEELGEEDLKEAKRIVEQTEANYTHIITSYDLYVDFVSEVTAIPTTFFVNEDGEIMGYAVSGVKSKEKWQEMVDQLLEQMDE